VEAGNPVTQARTTKRKSVQWSGRGAFLLATLVPLGAAFLLFWIYPIAAAAIFSFTNWHGFVSQTPFIGLANYTRAFQDPIFLQALRNTVVFVLITAPAGIALGLLLALAINQAGPLTQLFRTIYFVPVITSVIATAFVWRYMYQPQFGVFNQVLSLLGLPTQRWLLDPGQALLCVAAFAIWQGVGFNMVIFLAGLTTIDTVYYDAARVDGANSWQVFWKVTLPLLRQTMLFVMVTTIINGLQVFAPVYIMTSAIISGGESAPGGPMNRTLVIVVYQWLMAFKELELGYGAAMGMILLVIILVVTLLQLRWLRARWEY
jgi:ABC-type sugar transport system permease subunit